MVYAMPMGFLPPPRPYYSGEPTHAFGPPAPVPQLQELQPVSSPSPERVPQPLAAMTPNQPHLASNPPSRPHAEPLDAIQRSRINEQHQPASQEHADTAEHNTKRSPTILRTEEHDGLLKVVYDPEDLKRWRREMGMPEHAEPTEARRLDVKIVEKEQVASGEATFGQEVEDKVQALSLGGDQTGEKGEAASGGPDANQDVANQVHGPNLGDYHDRSAPPAPPVDPPRLAISFTHTGSSWASMPPSPIPSHYGGPPMHEYPPHLPLASHHAPHPANAMIPMPPGWAAYGYGHAHGPQPQVQNGGYRDSRTEQRFANRVDPTHPGGRMAAHHRHPKARPRKDSKEHGGHPSHGRHGGSQRYDRLREGTDRRGGHRGAEKTRREGGHEERGSEAKGGHALTAVPAA